MKLNDWIVANINNPDFTPEEFKLAGLDLNNTLMLPMEDYLNSKFITDNELFQNNLGIFQKDKFETFYKEKLSEFDDFLLDDAFLYDMFDPEIFNLEDPKIKNPEFTILRVLNPDKIAVGLGGRNKVGNREYGISELALMNNIYDPETKTFLDETPNDETLVNNPTKWFSRIIDPIVLALYEEDGEHKDPLSGLMVKHRKGDYKLDDEGHYYTERLNGRSTIGKLIVSGLDLLTVDGEGINKYDMFDADGIDKSVTGTIANTVASVLPMFLGKKVRLAYSGLLVARESLKTLPMLYGMVTSLTGGDDTNPVMNRLSAIGEILTGGTSEYSKANLLTLENLGMLSSLVATLWGQQEAIAKSIRALRSNKKLLLRALALAEREYATKASIIRALIRSNPGNKEVEALLDYIGDSSNWRNSPLGLAAMKKYVANVEGIVLNSNKLGQDASLVYMALISNTDVYSSMLDHGATKEEAALVALGSTLGMFAVDRYLHLGELFFDDATAAYLRQIRNTFTKDIDSWVNTLKAGVADLTTKLDKFRTLIKNGIDFGKKHTNLFIDDLKYHTTGFVGKAIGEGLEETSEELVTDLTKLLYEIAGALGVNTASKDVGSWDNALERYGMSFLGGALGGGMFYGVGAFRNGSFSTDLTQNELIYLVRNNKTDEVLKELDKWRDKGRLGSTKLSYRTQLDENGNRVFLTASSKEDSLNEFIYKQIKNTILLLDTIINSNDAAMSEDKLFDNMVLSEKRFTDLREYLLGASYSTLYQLRYQDIVNRVVNLLSSLKRASKTDTGLDYTNEEEYTSHILDSAKRNLSEEEELLRSKNLKALLDSLTNALDELQKFISGEYSMEYTEKMLFAIDPVLNKPFVAMTYDQWLYRNYGKRPEELSEDDKVKYKTKYLTYKSKELPLDLDSKFAIYKNIKEKLNPIILNILQNLDKFTKIQDIIANIDYDKITNYYNFDSVLDIYGETEESDSYVNRENYRAQREEKVREANLIAAGQIINKAIDESGGFIDPHMRRLIQLIIQLRNKDRKLYNLEILENTINDQNNGNGLTLLDTTVVELLSTIDVDNPDPNGKVWQSIVEAVKKSIATDIALYNLDLVSAFTYLSPIDENLFSTISSSNIEGSSISESITNLLGENFNNIDELFLALEQNKQFSLSPGALSIVDSIREAYIDGSLSGINYGRLDASENEETPTINNYRGAYDRYLDLIKNDPIILANKELDSKVLLANPVTDFIKSMSLSLNSNKNLEDVLLNISQRYELIESLQDLVLSPDEKESLLEASYIMELGKSIIFAASNTPSVFTPYGHNALLNEFAKNHSDIIKDYLELPVLNLDIANMFYTELDNYQKEIGVLDPKTNEYNKNSWLYISSKNEINKALLYLTAKKKWNKTTYDMLINHRDLFKFEYDGKLYDLLEGSESVPKVSEDTRNAVIYLNLLLSILYKKVHELLDSGWSYSDFLERSKILDKLCKLDEAVRLKTANLDLYISEDKLTYYDKAIMLATFVGLEPSKFYQFLYTRVKDDLSIVPLTIQQWNTRVGIAYYESPEIFALTLEYIKAKTNSKLPIIYGTFINGNGGAGKSRVVARNIANYALGEIWLSAPKKSQMNTLLESVGRGIAMINRESTKEDEKDLNNLMLLMLINIDNYKKVMAAIENNKPSDANIATIRTTEGTVLVPDLSLFNIHKIDNAPKLLIIDEATHLSNLELQIISEFCRVNDSRLILLGDRKQKGFSKIGLNLNREICLTIRTPNLGITLRDNNELHLYNLNSVEALLNELLDLDLTETNEAEYRLLVTSIYSKLGQIKFKVYNLTEINGDLFLDLLTSEFVSKLHGSIAFVGNTNSSTLKILQDANVNVDVLTEDQIQGLEYDYVVVDKEFTLPDGIHDITLANFLRDLYTMISRGRSGSILIDPQRKLRDYIGDNRVEFTLAKAVDIKQYANLFILEELSELENLMKNTGTLPNAQAQQPQSLTQLPQQQPLGQLEPLLQPLLEPENKLIKEVTDSELLTDNFDFDNHFYVLINTSIPVTLDLTQGIDVPDKKISLVKSFEPISSKIKDLQKNSTTSGFIILEVPKDKYKRNTYFDVNKLPDANGTVVPSKYIKNIVIVNPVQNLEDDIQSKLGDLLPDPNLTLLEFTDLMKPEDEIPDEYSDIYISDENNAPQSPILCYGEATLTGMGISILDGRLIYTIDDDLYDPQNPRDLLIFANGVGAYDSDWQYKALDEMSTFKESLLYDEWDYERLPKSITDKISKEAYNNAKWNIEVRDVNDYDNFPRTSTFIKDNLAIGTRKKAYLVVGDIVMDKVPGNPTWHITLGALSNPETWIKQITRTDGYSIPDRINAKKEELTKRLNNANITNLEEESIHNQIKLLDAYSNRIDLSNDNSDPVLYENYIESLGLQSTNNGGILRVPLKNKPIFPGITDIKRTNSLVRLTRITPKIVEAIQNRINNLQKRYNESKNVDEKISLRLRIETEEEHKKKYENMTEVSFRTLNPKVVVSPMYIYTPSSAIRSLTGIDDSLIGKGNVVFVTRDRKFKFDELAQEYLKQREEINKERRENGGVIDYRTSKHKLKIRMMPLVNLGVSFEDLSNEDLEELMSSTVSYLSKGKEVNSKSIFPFKTNFMGMRMYVGLWNFRFNLLQFNQEVTKFVERLVLTYGSLGFTEELLDNILRLKDLEWRKLNSQNWKLDGADLEYLDTHKDRPAYYKNICDDIDNFNKSLNNKVKSFRLGSDLVRGFYIRRLLGNNLETFYDKETINNGVNGTYMNMETTSKYLSLINSIFKNVLDPIVTCDYVDEHLQPKGVLSTNKGSRNSFANHLKVVASRNGVIEITDPYNLTTDKLDSSNDPTVIRFSSLFGLKGILGTFSHIPAVLMKMFKFTTIRLSYLNENNFDRDRFKITLKDTVEDPVTREKTVLSKDIDYFTIWDELNIPNDPDDYTVYDYGHDYSLLNMLDLAFHGTVLDIHSDALRDSSALFPKGFFADPLSTKEIVTDGENKWLTRAVLLLYYFGTNFNIQLPTFYITLLDLKDAETLSKQQSAPETLITSIDVDTLVQDFRNKYNLVSFENNFWEDLLEIAKELSSSGYSEDLIKTTILDNIDKYINSTIENNRETLFNNNIISVNDLASLLVLRGNDNKPLTFTQVISDWYSNLYNTLMPLITNLSRDRDNGIIISFGDQANSLTLKITRDLNGLAINKIAGEPDEDTFLITVKLIYDSLSKEKRLNLLATITLKNLEKNLNNYQGSSDIDMARNIILKLFESIINTIRSGQTKLDYLSRIESLRKSNCY